MIPYSYKIIHNLAPAYSSGFLSYTSFTGFISSLLNYLKIYKLTMISDAPHLNPINSCLLNRYYLHFSNEEIETHGHCQGTMKEPGFDLNMSDSKVCLPSLYTKQFLLINGNIQVVHHC